ncbi:MAG: hypothetical protein HY831_03330 [Candidatus Aenigmarchaeota archaeon]|nr:hypothetical protein [Candidatus Aenigmarchaeota archaeon]
MNEKRDYELTAFEELAMTYALGYFLYYSILNKINNSIIKPLNAMYNKLEKIVKESKTKER